MWAVCSDKCTVCAVYYCSDLYCKYSEKRPEYSLTVPLDYFWTRCVLFKVCQYHIFFFILWSWSSQPGFLQCLPPTILKNSTLDLESFSELSECSFHKNIFPSLCFLHLLLLHTPLKHTQMPKLIMIADSAKRYFRVNCYELLFSIYFLTFCVVGSHYSSHYNFMPCCVYSANLFQK